MSDQIKKELMDLLAEHAVIRAPVGESFTLASGAKSAYYFDGKRVIQSPEAFPLIGELVWNHAREVGAEAVGGLSAGCIPIADAAVAFDAYVKKAGLRAFYVTPAKKEHGTKEKLYQAFSPDEKPLVTVGRRVLIVDDVLTTGNSICEAIKEVEDRGAKVVSVLVLVDRQNPIAAENLRAHAVTALFKSDSNGNLSFAEGQGTVRELMHA